jgi:uncharacterized membrane-anchored protein
MLKAPLRIMIVAAVCVLGLAGIVVREGYERSRPPTSGSHDILMQMQAVDPRALLSGHYVIISLQTMLVLPADVVPCANFASVAENESWVALADLSPNARIDERTPGPHLYSPVGIAATQQAAQDIANQAGRNGLVVRGAAFCSELPDEQRGPGPVSVASVQTQLRGVERFHAPQTEAERIDASMREQGAGAQVFAIVNVGRDGRARLKGLNVNGEIIELNWL